MGNQCRLWVTNRDVSNTRERGKNDNYSVLGSYSQGVLSQAYNYNVSSVYASFQRQIFPVYCPIMHLRFESQLAVLCHE